MNYNWVQNNLHWPFKWVQIEMRRRTHACRKTYLWTFLFLKFWFSPNWLLVELEELRVCHSEESDQPKLAGTRVLGNISRIGSVNKSLPERHNSNKFSSLFPKLCEQLFRVTIHWCSFYWLLLPWICYKLVENIDITLLFGFVIFRRMRLYS